jgi:isopropylmalate/homocitrate/citramalate synthase
MRCGCHVPYRFTFFDRPMPEGFAYDERHHNCSGKHSGFLAYCVQHGVPTDSYTEVDHPLQQKIRQAVAHLAGLMKQIGVQRVDMADTIGTGTPLKVQKAIEATLQHFDIDHICGHFHDTYGQALANTLAALQMGVWNFQSSVAGLGGCPYAKGATGNVATEDVVYMLHGMGIATGIDLDKLVDAGAFVSDFLGRKPNSNVAKAILNKRAG